MPGVTITGPTDDATRVPPLFVYVREAWSDDWEFRPDLEVVNLTQTVPAFDLSSCTLRRDYGDVKGTHESDTSATEPVALRGWWVQVRLLGEQDSDDGDDVEQETTIWTGRVENDVQTIYGSDLAPSGVQEWVAHGPENWLRKIELDGSYWEDPDDAGEVMKLDWTPDMNARDKLRMLVGNRTTDAMTLGGYAFGGTSEWTRGQFVEYLLNRFATTDDVTWELNITQGTYLLDDLVDVVPVRAGDTVWAVLNRLINPQIGLAWRIRISDQDVFFVDVFTLVSTAKTFGGYTLPGNASITEIEADDPAITSADIVRSDDQLYDEIVVMGKRAVTCFSAQWNEFGNQLEEDWTSALETTYKAGTGVGSSEARDHDRARRADRFRSVYQRFHLGDSFEFGNENYLPWIKANGELTNRPWGSSRANWQNAVKRTLRQLPLLEGYDYTTTPPTNENPTGNTPDFMPLKAWVKPFYAEWGGLDHWVPVDTIGIGVQPLANDWGVMLSASPNHLLALNHWSGAEATAHPPLADYESLMVTLAVESDVCVTTSWRRSGTTAGTDIRKKIIQVNDAEFWLLAPFTRVGLNLDGTFQVAPTNDAGGDIIIGSVLRDDTDRLRAMLAGAVARYGEPRCRATIQYSGVLPMTDLVGGFLRIREHGGNAETIDAAVTSVTLTVGTSDEDPGSTTIKTGFAE